MRNSEEPWKDARETITPYCCMLTNRRVEKCLIALIFLIVGVTLRDWHLRIRSKATGFDASFMERLSISQDLNNKSYVFIGGHESSGTGLMRIQLDAHPDIRCGAEPMISLEVLRLWQQFSHPLKQRSIEAGIYPEALNNATRAYIQETIEHMGPPAKVLCHKQPTTFLYLPILYELFPTSKFIHMVRDGRGAVTSSMSRGLISKNKPEEALKTWEKQVSAYLKDCSVIGPEHCINVRYESLVLNTEVELRRIMNFIGVAWDPIVLHHEKVVDQLTNLNRFEPSTKQFRLAVHTNSLLAWSYANGSIPKTVLEKSCENFPMLQKLNYCPSKGYIPNYNEIPSNITYS